MIDRRGEDEDGLVREGRDPVLLREDLDHVRDDLEQAEGPDAVGAVAVLQEREQPPLEPDQAAATPTAPSTPTIRMTAA